MEPKSERRRRLVKYGAFGRIDLIAASANVRAASLDWHEGIALTLRAHQALRIAVFKDERQASLVVGEVLAEIFD